MRPRGIFTKAQGAGRRQRIVELYRRAGPHLGHRHAEDRRAAAEARRPDLRDQRRPQERHRSDQFPRQQAVLGQRPARRGRRPRKADWYKFFASNDNYDPDRIEYDREQLRKFYRNRGYYDFRVLSAWPSWSPDKNGFVRHLSRSTRAQKYKFGKLTVITELKKLEPRHSCGRCCRSTPASSIRATKIEQATDALTFAAGVGGLRLRRRAARTTRPTATSTPSTSPSTSRKARGSTSTASTSSATPTPSTTVIRREMLLTEGDAYNRVLVDRSKNKIKALGFFKDVDITNQPGSAPDRPICRSRSTEQPTGELSFSAGYSSLDQLVLDLGVSQRNFRGRGEDLRVRISVGSLRQHIDLSLHRAAVRPATCAPARTSSATAITSAAIPRSIRSRPAATSDSASRSTAMPTSPAAIPCRATASSSIPASATAAASTPRSATSAGSYITSALGYTLNVDRRNDPMNPTRGCKASLRQDFAGLGGDVHYVKTESEFDWYHGFAKNWILTVPPTGRLHRRLGRQHRPHRRPLLRGRLQLPRLPGGRHRPARHRVSWSA